MLSAVLHFFFQDFHLQHLLKIRFSSTTQHNVELNIKCVLLLLFSSKPTVKISKRVVDVSGVVCSPGLGGSSHQVLLWAAWAGRGLLQPQHGPDHTSAVPGAERGRGGGGDRSNIAITSSPKPPLSSVPGFTKKTNTQTLSFLAPQTRINCRRSCHQGTLPPTTSKMLKPRRPSSCPSLCRTQCWPGCSSWTRPRMVARALTFQFATFHI